MIGQWKSRISALTGNRTKDDRMIWNRNAPSQCNNTKESCSFSPSLQNDKKGNSSTYLLGIMKNPLVSAQVFRLAFFIVEKKGVYKI